MSEADPILRTVARSVFYLVLLFSLHMLWRGHNEPGGGFIAGLIASAAMILYRVAYGESATRLNPLALLPWGLGVAGLTGLLPFALGRPFLKSDYGYVTTPLSGEFEWATAFVFDVGVYLVVVGATMSVIANLAFARPTKTPDSLANGTGGMVSEVLPEAVPDLPPVQNAPTQPRGEVR